MSSFKLLRATALIVATASLSGCFQPLYGEANHPGLVEDMRAIEVVQINGRVGHYLGDFLITDLNGTGRTPKPKYKLVVTTSVGVATPTVESQLNVADAATVTLTASFVLSKIEGGAIVIAGVANSSAVYDRSAQRYADLRANRDAEIRDARSIANELELRIGAALAEQNAKK